ncbi:hypothetical protein NPX13_g6184 [Xylaria arbuscula]|uniref:Uncharacterized protein n=1 Tax=Xylaria arbuscula TaxID=114810 RepID=A0A9W8NCX2_9PEZI|nr:hypothetical protein NPX13_g6184 [Xylaria arbuscula]
MLVNVPAVEKAASFTFSLIATAISLKFRRTRDARPIHPLHNSREQNRSNERGRLGNPISWGMRSILCIPLMGNAIYLAGDELQLLVDVLISRGIFDEATKSRLMVQYSCKKLAKDNGCVVRLEHSETTGNAAKVPYARMEFGNAVFVNHIYVAIRDENDLWIAMGGSACDVEVARTYPHQRLEDVPRWTWQQHAHIRPGCGQGVEMTGAPGGQTYRLHRRHLRTPTAPTRAVNVLCGKGLHETRNETDREPMEEDVKGVGTGEGSTEVEGQIQKGGWMPAEKLDGVKGV